MLKTISLLAAGAMDSLRRTCLLNLTLMGVQQLSYIGAFFLLQTLLVMRDGESSGWIAWVCVLALLGICYCFINLHYLVSASIGAYAISSSLRLRLCERLRKVSLAFFKVRDTGEISGALIDDIASMESLFAMYLFDLTACLVFPLLLCVVMLFFSWQITGVLLLSTLCAFPLVWLACRVAASQGDEYFRARDNSFSILMDYIGGIKELKAVDLTGLRYTPLFESWKHYMRLSMKMEGQYGFLALAYSCVLDIGFLATLLVGMYLVDTNVVGVAAFMFFLIVGCRFVEPMRELGMVLPELRHGLTAAQKLCGFLETPLPPILPSEEKRGHAVEFKNVSFAYNDKEVIHDLTFSMPEGSVTALVGHSGSGKSTIAHLLLRFWDVQKGKITIGGADIRSFTPEELYTNFSVVFQDVYLFDDTVFNNIHMARPEATKEEVMEAARLARCHEFIMGLENGYDTRVGEGGARLSGGEKQRLSIARAILKNAPIIVLDEATASLDPENELSIQEGLNVLLRGKTLLVIAHRLETIRNADSILVLDQGTIHECGTHDDLLGIDGIYARLWKLQNSIKSWQLAPQLV